MDSDYPRFRRHSRLGLFGFFRLIPGPALLHDWAVWRIGDAGANQGGTGLFFVHHLSSGAARCGLLDFQDAVYGPITYDIASLMRDAFLSWDEDFCLDITIRYWDKARQAGLPVGDDFGEFYKGVEWMGLQRHLKVAGIFARLTLRDGKPQYLADTPRFLGYIRATCARYVTLRPLLKLVEDLEGISPAINLAPPDLRRRD